MTRWSPDLDLLQFGALRPEPVHAGFQPVDAMGVQIELDETRTGKIGRKRPRRGRRGWPRAAPATSMASAHEIECRTPHPGDLAKGARR